MDNIRIVLVNTTHPGNIGAAARAMKTMCLSQLYLVAPERYPSAEATARASGADDILAQAQVCTHLPEAIADCHLVLGASARSRTIQWPQLTPREAAQLLAQGSQTGPVALLFGQERAGLSNEELAYCHYQVNIAANPAYPSLNLAAAVQILAYEILQAVPQHPTTATLIPEATDHWVSSLEMEQFYTYLENLLITIGFLDPQNPKYLMRRIRRWLNRGRLESMELNILRGILSALYKKSVQPKP